MLALPRKYVLNKSTFKTASELGEALTMLFKDNGHDSRWFVRGDLIYTDEDRLFVRSGNVMALPLRCSFTGTLFSGTMKIGSINIRASGLWHKKVSFRGGVSWQVLEPVRIEGVLTADYNFI